MAFMAFMQAFVLFVSFMIFIGFIVIPFMPILPFMPFMTAAVFMTVEPLVPFAAGRFMTPARVLFQRDSGIAGYVCLDASLSHGVDTMHYI